MVESAEYENPISEISTPLTDPIFSPLGYTNPRSPFVDEISDIDGNDLYLVPGDSITVVFIFPLPWDLSYSKVPSVAE